MIQSPLGKGKQRMFRTSRSSNNRLLLAAVSTTLLLVLMLTVFSTKKENYLTCDSSDAPLYDVVFDAGSTGTRVHVFEFKRSGAGLTLTWEHFSQVKPGLSFYGGNPDGAAASITGLLGDAVGAVPERFHKCTSITLKATAGLRLLPVEQREAILRRVGEEVHARTPFTNRGVSLINGNEEGVYAWLTVSFLLGRLFSAGRPAVVTIDMGGASTQIVSEVDEADGEWLPFNYVSRVRLSDRQITLYHHSYLGFGLNEARGRIYEAAAAAKLRSFPCFPKGHSTKLNAGDFLVRGGAGSGAQSFGECERLVTAALFGGTATSAGMAVARGEAVAPAAACEFRTCGIKGVPQPALVLDRQEIYAFSYFCDRMAPFLPANSGAGVYVETLKRAAEAVCDQPQHEHNKDTMCLDLTYLYSYLHQGLGLTDQTPVRVQEKIAGQSVSWSLGASILYLLKGTL